MKLYKQDWDYRKNNTDKYPQLKSITTQPNSFWFVDNPKKQIKRLSGRIRRLCRRAHPYQPVIVLYSISLNTSSPGRVVSTYDLKPEM